MPALDDHIDELFDTYFYYVATPDQWEKIRQEGIRPDENGIIPALTTNGREFVERFAMQRYGTTDVVVIRFNPCSLGMDAQRTLHDPSLPAGGSLMEIRAKRIGPLLLEKDR